MTKDIQGAFGIFIVGTMLSLIGSGIWFGSSQIGAINQLAGFSVINLQSLGGFGIPKAALDFFGAIVTMLTWSYPYLDNAFGFVLKLFLYIVSVGVVIGLWQMFIIVAQGAVNFIKNIF
jgi:hypothetical protein